MYKHTCGHLDRGADIAVPGLTTLEQAGLELWPDYIELYLTVGRGPQPFVVFGNSSSGWCGHSTVGDTSSPLGYLLLFSPCSFLVLHPHLFSIFSVSLLSTFVSPAISFSFWELPRAPETT